MRQPSEFSGSQRRVATQNNHRDSVFNRHWVSCSGVGTAPTAAGPNLSKVDKYSTVAETVF